MVELWVVWLFLLAARRHRIKNAPKRMPVEGKHRPLPKAEALLAEQHHAMVAEWRSGEQPQVPAHRRHVYRPPSQRQLDAIRARRLAPVKAFRDNPLTAPLAGPLAPPVVCSSMPYVEPDPLSIDGPTGVFDRDWIDEILKAGAPR